MDTFSAELRQRVVAARTALRTAEEAGDLDAERVYAGELESLLRLALENGVSVPPEPSEPSGPPEPSGPSGPSEGAG